MKRSFQKVLQALLGLDGYLDLFARYRLRVSRFDPLDEAFRAFLARLPDDGIVLDVGANVGVMTVRLARHLRRGTVHAFEPNPVSREVARRLVTRLGLTNVVLHPWALGRTSGDVEMVMPVDAAVRQHGLSRVLADPKDATPGERFRAECRALDDFPSLFPAGVPVRGLKIDVEDSEADVLEGARALLLAERPLVYCELWLTPNRDRAVAFMRGLGFEALVRRKGGLEPFSPVEHASDQDFFFVPAARA